MAAHVAAANCRCIGSGADPVERRGVPQRLVLVEGVPQRLVLVEGVRQRPVLVEGVRQRLVLVEGVSVGVGEHGKPAGG